MYAMSLPRFAPDALNITYASLLPPPQAMTSDDYRKAGRLAKFLLAAKAIKPIELQEIIEQTHHGIMLAELLRSGFSHQHETARATGTEIFGDASIDAGWVSMPSADFAMHMEDECVIATVCGEMWMADLSGLRQHGKGVVDAAWLALALVSAHLWPIMWPEDLLTLSWSDEELLSELDDAINTCGSDDPLVLESHIQNQDSHYQLCDLGLILHALGLKAVHTDVATRGLWWQADHCGMRKWAEDQPMQALNDLRKAIQSIDSPAWKDALGKVELALREHIESDEQAEIWLGKRQAMLEAQEEGLIYAELALVISTDGRFEEQTMDEIHQGIMEAGETPGLAVNIDTFAGNEVADQLTRNLALAKRITQHLYDTTEILADAP